MGDPVPMAEVIRGDILESTHLGHAVIVGPDGDIRHAWGEPETVILPRSSSKILQALPLVESGAGEGLSGEQLALACASHRGERFHVERVRRWLADLGLGEEALKCGPQPSRDEELAHAMIRADQPVSPVFNWCSGKHTGFLMLARHLGASLDYVDPDHPVQRAVRGAFEDMTGAASPGYGIDGCSAPNFATTLVGLARAMARIAAAREDGNARERAAARLRAAMIAHPEYVAGTGDPVTDFMRAAREPVAVKSGAEGVYVAILPARGLGIAVKIADGASRASELAMAALLVRLGVLDRAGPVAAHHLHRPVRNWNGEVTGFERPVAALLA